jgi:hypothetical protein
MDSALCFLSAEFYTLRTALQIARNHGPHQNRAQAEQVVGNDIGRKQGPVPLLKARHGFKRELEKVVYDPQKLIATSKLHGGLASTRSVAQTRKNPNIKLPVMLMRSIPCGKAASLKRVMIRVRK